MPLHHQNLDGRDVHHPGRAGRNARALPTPPQPPPYTVQDTSPQLPRPTTEQTPLRHAPSTQRYGSNANPSIPVRTNPVVQTRIPDPERSGVTTMKIQTGNNRFNIFSYLFIGLVVGYMFTNVVHSATWEFEEVSHDRMRRIWSREINEHESLRLRMLEESTAWKSEKIARDAERAQWERKQREGRAGIAWEGMSRSDRCLRYGTREYSATLTHVPLGFDAMAECLKKPASINGQELLPTRCEDPGTCGNAIGHWEVEGDAMCSPVWGWIYDKGCDGNTNGKRRFEGQLINLHPGDDWHVLCPTTPVVIRGRHISAPDTCADWGRKGIWGIWYVPDDQCR